MDTYYFCYSPVWTRVSLVQGDEEGVASLAEDNPDHIYFEAELAL